MLSRIANKRLAEFSPRFAFFIGSHGKSMAIHAAKAALRPLDTTVHSIDGNRSFMDILAKGPQNRSLFASLLRSYSSYDHLLLEAHEPIDLSFLEEKLERPLVVVSGVTEADIQAHGSLEKYIRHFCPFIKEYKNAYDLIINADIPKYEEALAKLQANKVTTFGVYSQADYQATNIEFIEDESASYTRSIGVRSKIQAEGSVIPLQLTGGAGNAHLYAAMSGLIVANSLGGNVVDALAYLRQMKPLPGRQVFIPGIKKSTLVDDSYSNHFEATAYTVDSFSHISLSEDAKRVVVVGGVEEHGNQLEGLHCELGAMMANAGVDLLVAIGEPAQDVLRCAKDAGMEDDQLYHFMDIEQAGKFVQHEMTPGDLVLITGAKADYFERVAKELMAFPLQAKQDLLDRGGLN